MRVLILCLTLLAGGCAFVDYDGVAQGRFSGTLLVVWVGGDQNPYLGDGDFLYVPLPDRALTFTRGDGAGSAPGAEVIQPEAFYTDGGSVPRSVQHIRGFNAWGFGPAYVIHDWVFHARKCLNAGQATPRMQALAQVTFTESARIMAETIRSLDNVDDASGPVIASITAGPVSERLWRSKTCRQLTDDDKALVAQIQAREARAGGARLRSAPQAPLRTGADLVAITVARVQFD